MTASRAPLEYGDFQTPWELALASCRLLAELGLRPRSLLEPTCGLGAFLKAGLAVFSSLIEAAGFDLNPEHVRAAKADVLGLGAPAAIRISRANFFEQDWRTLAGAMPEPLLVLGNPPWVTNSAIGASGGSNLPVKSNIHRFEGFDALTGKSNFDISEYMLIRLCEALRGGNAAIAMLCKTAVARRVMAYCWKRRFEMGGCRIFPIHARRSFGAAVDGCLFLAPFHPRAGDFSCVVHQEFSASSAARRIGCRGGMMIADLDRFERFRHLAGPSCYRWRSGIKHDCAKVMEFTELNGRLVNGLGEAPELEETFLYPLKKGSAIAGSGKAESRWMLVTGRTMGDDTSAIARLAPKTWQYLLDHAARLDERRSAVYRRRPRFSVFGVGPYSFALWKVAISGLHKKLDFAVVGPASGKPVVLDDTTYFLPGDTARQAHALAEVLNSAPAQEFYRSLIFWDAKRPITLEVLRRLSLEKLLTRTTAAGAPKPR